VHLVNRLNFPLMGGSMEVFREIPVPKSGSKGFQFTIVRWRHLMRQNSGGCLHQNPFAGKAEPLLGDMETFLRHYFFFFFLDMILIHANALISSQIIENCLIDIVGVKYCHGDCGGEM